MEKISVKTTGKFMLIDPQTGYEMVEDELREVPKSHFVVERLELGQLTTGKATKDEEIVEDAKIDDTPPAPPAKTAAPKKPGK